MKSTDTFLIIILTLVFFTQPVVSQIRDSSLTKTTTIIPLPIVGANPTFGIVYGLAVSANTIFGDPSNTRMSTSVSTVNYSTNKQLLAFVKTNIYLSEDQWILLGDWRYFDSSQPTFGLGTGPQSNKLVVTDSIEYQDGMFTKTLDKEQQMEFNYIKISEIALYKINKSFYLGLGYHLDKHYNINDNLLQLDTLYGKQPSVTSHYRYSKYRGFNPEEYTLSGISFNASYDSRDNSATPYKGKYALLSYRMNPVFLGSTQNSSSVWLEYRDYYNLTPTKHKNILAFWAYADFPISGYRPYMDLPAIGWDQFGRSGRAYTQGRFRGSSLIYNEIEYRAHVWGSKNNPELIGAVAFVNATTASNTDAGIDLYEYMNLGYGIGLRIMIVKSSRINVTIDYGWGQYGAQGIFINANEVF